MRDVGNVVVREESGMIQMHYGNRVKMNTQVLNHVGQGFVGKTMNREVYIEIWMLVFGWALG